MNISGLRRSVGVTALLLAPLLSSTAAAQSVPSSASRTASTPSLSTSGPEAVVGLRPATTKKTITFQDALNLAAAQSWDLRALAQRVEAQDALVQRAWSGVLPSLSAQASYTYNLPSQKVEFVDQDAVDQQALLFRSIGGIVAGAAAQNPDPAAQAEQQAQAQALLDAADTIEKNGPTSIEITPEHVGNAAITLTVPLFSGAAIPALLNASEGVSAMKRSVDQARASVVLGVARAYYGAWTAQRFVAIADEQVQATTAHRELTQKQTEGGVTTPLALQRAELDVVRAEQARRTAQQTAAQARANLGLLLGVVDDFDVAAPPDVPHVEEGKDVVALVDSARGARADLVAQRMAVEMAERTVSSTWLQFLPSVALQAQGRGTTFTGGLTSEPLTAAVTLQASIPLYDGGYRWSQMREAEARLSEERIKLEQLEARIEGQVRGNTDDLRVRAEALVTAQRAVALARATKENAAHLYELGSATNLDVVDANVAVFAAEFDEAKAALDVAQGRLGLAFILGQLAP